MSESEERATMDYAQLAEVDLDALDHLSEAELAAHFADLASRATEGQLRQVLGIAPGDEKGHEELAALYVVRRCRTAARMRALRDCR